MREVVRTESEVQAYMASEAPWRPEPPFGSHNLNAVDDTKGGHWEGVS